MEDSPGGWLTGLVGIKSWAPISRRWKRVEEQEGEKIQLGRGPSAFGEAYFISGFLTLHEVDKHHGLCYCAEKTSDMEEYFLMQGAQ